MAVILILITFRAPQAFNYSATWLEVILLLTASPREVSLGADFGTRTRMFSE